MIIHRRIDPVKDREMLLEFHCEINYECESSFAKEIPYELYREKWFTADNQIEEFITALASNMGDCNTIADILENEEGTILGYLWMSFFDLNDYRLLVAEIREIYVAKEFRKSGIGKYAIEYAEKAARVKGADILRSGTGYENAGSRTIHEHYGFKPYRIEYEKLLK